MRAPCGKAAGSALGATGDTRCAAEADVTAGCAAASGTACSGSPPATDRPLDTAHTATAAPASSAIAPATAQRGTAGQRRAGAGGNKLVNKRCASEGSDKARPGAANKVGRGATEAAKAGEFN